MEKLFMRNLRNRHETHVTKLTFETGYCIVKMTKNIGFLLKINNFT